MPATDCGKCTCDVRNATLAHSSFVLKLRRL
jgi:hypothetical protein